ncbi:ATP-dependent DNA helicase Q1 [Hypsibius exemplaris]|uniref:ATP-dependent DNA helicase n=1 Tax=Hypsibius exemplaris TaxID=2072580 RepID=A0A9X6RJI2_HYPEX|nr:ATP-dependent DNA helicase Q1 [Hypsibius exemplaris]
MAFKGNAQSELAMLDADIGTIDQQILELRKRKAELEHKKRDAQARVKMHQERDQAYDWEGMTFPWTKTVDMIRDKMCIKSFRHLQLSTINATMSGKDCILIMPTGGGKSLCYQIPAYASKGVTVVISPLVSLMEDQLLSLQRYGIEGAVLNSSTTKEDTKAVYDKMTDPNSTLKIIYVTPEKIAKTKTFNMKMEAMYGMQRLSRVVIDEVHCCSQWGHDFRPDFKALNILKRQYPKTPILGLTATATVRVLRDIQDMLGMSGAVVFRAPFNRPNLFYEVHHKAATPSDAMNALADLIRHRFDEQSGIVYCLSVKDTEEVARDLTQRGIHARCYHAQLTQDARNKTHHEWLRNRIHVVVATVAFGMGIDKPDVRFVIHHTLSKSIETFYQESGRAGRDGKTAHCILFYRMPDIFRLSSITYQEKVGEENLRGMVAFAQNISQCRRAPLAEHFGEEWIADMCPAMCDMCKKAATRKIVTVDVTEAAVKIINAIEVGRKKTQSGKCTALQLMEAWIGKNDRPKLGALRVATKEDCERIVVEMMLNGYLTQTYQAAQYGYNSYLQPGPLAKSLLKGPARVEIAFESKEKEKEKEKEKTFKQPTVAPLSAVLLAAVEEEDAELNSAFDSFQECEEVLDAVEVPVIDIKPDDDDDDVEELVVVKKTPAPKDVVLELDLPGGFSQVDDFDFASPPGLKRSVSGSAAGQKKRRGLF